MEPMDYARERAQRAYERDGKNATESSRGPSQSLAREPSGARPIEQEVGCLCKVHPRVQLFGRRLRDAASSSPTSPENLGGEWVRCWYCWLLSVFEKWRGSGEG